MILSDRCAVCPYINTAFLSILWMDILPLLGWGYYKWCYNKHDFCCTDVHISIGYVPKRGTDGFRVYVYSFLVNSA